MDLQAELLDSFSKALLSHIIYKNSLPKSFYLSIICFKIK